ncbi:MAG: hypothetical protein H6628_09405 [Calditrichae bacterium]|nr:hypothetical protein [Calditrichia bacterium]
MILQNGPILGVGTAIVFGAKVLNEEPAGFGAALGSDRLDQENPNKERRDVKRSFHDQENPNKERRDVKRSFHGRFPFTSAAPL